MCSQSTSLLVRSAGPWANLDNDVTVASLGLLAARRVRPLGSVVVSSDRTAQLVARDLRPVWHPFTAHSAWPDDEPLVIDRAEGMHLIDTDGNRYLDGVSSLWLTVHGHRVPEIDEAIRDQLDWLHHATFLGLTHEPGIALAEQLLDSA